MMPLKEAPKRKTSPGKQATFRMRAWQPIIWLLLLALVAVPVTAVPVAIAPVGVGPMPPDPEVEPAPEPVSDPVPEPAPDPAVPTFVNGLSQSVFSANSADWVRGEAWVESNFDSDNDGKLDRIHIDITRPKETATEGLKVPVIFEDSPYYANLGPSRNWAVDHEIGFPPASRAAEPYFAAKSTSPIISTIYESTWLPRGFAVVHAESPGTGLSDGCPTSGGPNETDGGRVVIDWLNGRKPAFTTRTGTTQVFADWTTGKVGMMGTSYNGTLPIAVATTGVQGLEAIVPISAISNWYDYYRANGMVRAPFTYQGEDLDVLADAVYSRADEPAPGPRTICRGVIDDLAAHQDRVTGDFSDFWNDRNYMKDVANVHAAVLLAHGNADFNVMTKNAAQFYEAIKAMGVPHQFYFHQSGHGGAPPDVLINRWFTRYLWAVQNGVESLPKSWVVRESNACPPRATTVAGDQSNVTTLAVADTSPFPLGFTLTIPQTNSNGSTTTTTRVITNIPDGTHLTLASAVATSAGQKVADGAVVSLVCGTANPTDYPEWPDPAAAPAVMNFMSGGLTRGGLTFQAVDPATLPENLIDNALVTASTSMNASSSTVRLIYQTPVLMQNIRISGTPRLSLNIAFSKPKANLTAVLISYPGTTGNGTILTRGWIDPENRTSPALTEPITPGTFYQMNFDMQPKDVVVVAGRRLAIMVLSSDNEATIRPAAGTQLTFDLARSTVTLPIVGGARALGQAIGVNAPTVGYTIDPASPTGQNGWYTGNVSLTWQTTDGGAALTKSGCDDEVFRVDGQYTPSCTVSNVVDVAGPVTVSVKRDATPPTLAPSVSPNPVLLHGSATASPNATDNLSGVASASCGAVDTSSVGAKTVVCTATDNAGNMASASLVYNVIYNFTGFSQPVDNSLALNAANSGQAIPLKWRITDANGDPVTNLASVNVTAVSFTCPLAGTPDQIEEYAAGSSGLLNQGDGNYQFNWKTPTSYAKSCKTMKLDLGEGPGNEHTALFQFPK